MSHPLLLFHILYTVELDDLIEELSQHIQPQQTWQERQDLSNESWERIRPIIFKEELVKLALRPDDVSVHTYLFVFIYLILHCIKVCSYCGKNSPLFRCQDCGLPNYMCSACDERIHYTQPLHNREVWHNGYFEPISNRSSEGI